MIEIAICLAIIGIALVAIVGVLPLGMNVQRENRESTIINQDSTILLEAIRNGARGMDDLTNYVYAITNSWTLFNADGTVKSSGINGYTFNTVSTPLPVPPFSSAPLTNGANVVALLSTPEFIANISNLPATNYPFVPGVFYISQSYGNNFNCYSNHIVAYVRSISGPAVEKPPQDNQILQEDTFTYRLYCVNAPVATDTNIFNTAIYPYGPPAYNQQLAQNLHELRLTFLWPQNPNGKLGNGRQTFRTLVAGQIATDIVNGNYLYFYQPQSFAITK